MYEINIIIATVMWFVFGVGTFNLFRIYKGSNDGMLPIIILWPFVLWIAALFLANKGKIN